MNDEQRKLELFAYVAGYESRDMEVRALRKALESVYDRATREVPPTVEAHQSVLKDISEDALAALASGEEGEEE